MKHVKDINEGVYRSPKWMRNLADFEINTGDDIKGEPSKGRQRKIDAENKRKEEKRKKRRKKEEEKRREEEEK